MNVKYLAIFILSFCALAAKEPPKNVPVDLYEPTFEDGVLRTEKGGVLKWDDIRIQAKKISYTRKEIDGKYVVSVEAQDELMVEYAGKVFVGKKLEYNFLTHTGVIYQGKTQSGSWYVGGEKIFLKSNGSYRIYNSYLTTCETSEGEWQIRSRSVTSRGNNVFTARNIQVRFFRLPIFWFPKIKLKLGNLRDIPVEYSARTGGGQGPKFNMRYQLLNFDGFKGYLQLDYWFKHGPGGSIQTDYKSPNRATDFKTNSFMTYNYSPRSSYKGFRYRFVGDFIDRYLTDYLQVTGQYEVLSDPKVLSTYFNRDYFLYTERHTHLQFRVEQKTYIANLVTTPRVNYFQTVNQQLPELYWHVHPVSMPQFPLTFTSYFSVGYLDYIFANEIPNVTGFRSARMKIFPTLYLPLRVNAFSITPKASYIGMGYSQGPNNHSLWQNVFNVSCTANLHFTKVFSQSFKHFIEPYCFYTYYPSPSEPVNNHYIFSSQDVYTYLNELRFGIRNQLYYKNSDAIYHPLYLDIFSYAFFNNTTIGSTIPKLYANLSCYLPYLYGEVQYAWNLQHNQIDHINVRTDWTISEYAAVGISYLHRGAYDYRKADHENFFLDVFRDQETLVNSPVSDKRSTLLGRFYLRVFHDFILEGYTRAGWDRTNLPTYNEYRFDVTKFLRCNWRIKLSFMHTEQVAFRFTCAFKLGGRPLKEKPSAFIFW